MANTTIGGIGLSATVSADSDLNEIEQGGVSKKVTNSVVKAYMSQGLYSFRGSYNASSNTFPTIGGRGASGVPSIGDTYVISVAGTLDGNIMQAGDSITAISNTPGQTAANWYIGSTHLSYTPENVANKVTAFSSPTDTQYPSALLVKTQLDLKLNDVTNGTGTGVTQVTTPVAGTREIARLAAASTDVVVTQGAAGAPNTVGLNGTTLKYWTEDSQLLTSTTQRLIWQPKDPNGTYVRANTVQVIAVPKGLTLRDPSESGSTFPVNFRSGLDLQIKSTTGTSSTFANGGYAFGTGNTTQPGGIALGVSNTANANFGTGTIALGYGNTPGTKNIGYSSGISNGYTNSGNGVGLGWNNVTSNFSTIAIGESNVTNFGMALGFQNTSTGSSIQYFPIAIGFKTALTAGSISIHNYADSTTRTDQGIDGFQRFGRNVSIPFARTILTVTDYTNTVWRDIPGSFLIPDSGNSVFAPRTRFNFIFRLIDNGGTGSTIPTRQGVIILEVWDNGAISGLKALQGGDSDLLTYLNFRVIAGTGGVLKLQYAFIADPSAGAPSTRNSKITIYGEYLNTAFE